MSVKDWAITEGGNNTTLGVTLTEGATPYANMNNAVRQAMADVRLEVASFGTVVAAASAPDIAIDGQVHSVSGSTTISAFATAPYGIYRVLYFETAVTLANTSLLTLPGAANITMSAGDKAGMRSLGSGYWTMEWRTKNNDELTGSSLSITSSSAGTLATLTSTEAGATSGPDLVLHRDSASPADNDLIGTIIFRGEDDGGAATDYARIQAQIRDTTDGTEDCSLYFTTLAAGAETQLAIENGGMRALGFSLANKGQGTLNMAGVYVGGHGTVAQVVSDTDATYTTADTDFPLDNTIPQNTEGNEILSVAITPVNASSILRIRFSAFVGATSAGSGGAGLFVDTTANALNATAFYVAGTASYANPVIEHEVSAGSTSARTYKIRIGPDVGGPVSIRVNGDSSARLFGGVATASLTVTEVLPQ